MQIFSECDARALAFRESGLPLTAARTPTSHTSSLLSHFRRGERVSRRAVLVLAIPLRLRQWFPLCSLSPRLSLLRERISHVHALRLSRFLSPHFPLGLCGPDTSPSGTPFSPSLSMGWAARRSVDGDDLHDLTG